MNFYEGDCGPHPSPKRYSGRNGSVSHCESRTEVGTAKFTADTRILVLLCILILGIFVVSSFFGFGYGFVVFLVLRIEPH